MTNRKSILPWQPIGVGSKSVDVPTSHVPADAAAVLAESSPVLELPVLLVLELPVLLVLESPELLVLEPSAGLVAGCDPPPVKLDDSALSRAQAGARSRAAATLSRASGRRRISARAYRRARRKATLGPVPGLYECGDLVQREALCTHRHGESDLLEHVGGE